MDDYERARALLHEHADDTDFAGVRQESLIARAEEATDFRFPATYRRFLCEFGAGGLGGTEIYGVIDDDWDESSVPDAIWLNLSNWRDGVTPRTFFTIYGLGDGTFYALDGRRGDAELPVVAYHAALEEDEEPEQVASDFGALLRALIEEELAA